MNRRGDLSLFLAGDALITRPWSEDPCPAFQPVLREMRAADVTIVNLETLVHEFQGYPQADSGGTYVASPPQIAQELAWAGVDMVAHANNHAFDYGSIGVLENLDNVRKAGVVLAGTGVDLEAARAPGYFKHANGTVGLVSAASTFVDYGRASVSRPDSRGRPGLNPLEVGKPHVVRLTRPSANALQSLARLLGYRARRASRDRFRALGLDFRVGSSHAFERGPCLEDADRDANLAAVRRAVDGSDLTVVSVHAHRQGAWLGAFARQTIDLGAQVFFAHGPHEVRGIELYKGRPIFYSLGDFVFEIQQIERLPSEVYTRNGLPSDAPRSELRSPYLSVREPWESVAVVMRTRDQRLVDLRLLPLDLGVEEPPEVRGRPRYADPELGESIIERVAERSRPYGTRIDYVRELNQGVVALH